MFKQFLVAAFLAALALAMPTAASAAIDIGLVVDGSGSIDDSDWKLQREGFSTALRDSANVPLDGSVAITVVQFSSGTQVEVPRTVIDSKEKLDAVVAKIESMEQRQGGTDPDNGITAGLEALKPFRDDTKTVLCLSSDGTGADLTDSVAAAKAGGIERFSVIGIDDYGNTEQLRSYYGPHIYGGGAMTIARNTVEFASLIAGSCFGDAVTLRALEVNQGAQDWHNSKTLLELRDTVVRAFVETPPIDRLPPSGPDEAFLRAVRAGGHRDSVTPVTLHVAGVGLDATSLVTDQAFDAPQVVLTPAFARRLHPRVVYWGLVVRLQPGTPMGRFEHDVDALVPDESIAYQTLPTTRAKVERAVRPESGALTIFAIVVALIGLFVVGQTLARQTVLDAGDHATLRGLGCARWQLFTLAMARTALAAGLGAVVALTGAFLLSPMMPIGVARLAEPSPGFDFDGLVLLAGAALVFLAVMVLEVLPAWHAAVVSDPRPSRRHRLVELSIRAGMPPVPAAGVRMALDPATDAGTVPVRTTISSALVAVAAVTAALVIAASLGHLVRTPRLYGWNWDATVAVNGDETGQTAQRTAAAVHALRTEPGIGTFARFDISTLQLGGHPVTTIGTRPGSRPSFVIAAGRRPRTPHAIALGARTMQTLGVRIGDRVTATDREGRPVPLGVVGRVVLPALGTYVGSDKTSPGEGALVSESALAELAPRFDSHDFVVDFAAGTSTRQQRSAIARVRRIGASEDTAFGVPQPADIVAYREVRSTPTLLAAALAALATLTLAHGLISSVRRRRRELGMLKTMGFTRRQVSAAISWQATTVILIALAIGVPLGIVGGRWAWTGLANNLGTVADPLVPGGTLALGALVVLVAGNLVAYLPGRVASRLGPAAAFEE